MKDCMPDFRACFWNAMEKWIFETSWSTTEIFQLISGIYTAYYAFQHCIWTPTMSLTKADIVSLEVLLRAVIPYLLPSILLPYPLMILYKSSQHIDGQRLQLQILIIIKIAMVYIFINLPYSITFLVQYSMMLSKVSTYLYTKLSYISEIMTNLI